MGKISYYDKMRMMILHEQGLGAKAIIAKYPYKGWKLVTVKAICKPIEQTGFAVNRKPGSGRPSTARTTDNIEKVDVLICSQDGETMRKTIKQLKTTIDNEALNNFNNCTGIN